MSKRKNSTLSIGSISEATLRLEDLIPALLWDLKRLHLSRSERSTVSRIDRESSAAGDDDPYWLETAPYEWNELETIAEAHTPDYCYFGSTEGDGACIGVWPSHDSIREDIESGTIASYGDSRGDRYPDRESAIAANPGASYVAHVSDHGNLTLYRKSGRSWREVFAIV